MSNFILSPLDRATDSNGRPIAGAKLYTYAAGTTINKATYSDEDLTSANANPVVADSDGWFGPIYGVDNEPYKLVLKDASDVILEEWDNVNVALLSSNASVAALGISIINPITYGAVGDGAADESAEVQEAIDAANAAGGGTVYLLGKTYRCDNQLTLYSNIRIVGPGTLDFSNCTDDSYIQARGSFSRVSASLVNFTYGASAVTISADVPPSPGDLLFLGGGDWIGLAAAGELHECASYSGTTLRVREPLLNLNSTGTVGRAESLIENVVLEDFTIISSTGAAGNPSVVSFYGCRDVAIRSVRFDGVKNYGIKLERVYAAKVSDCLFNQGSSSNTFFGTGVFLDGANKHITIEGCFLQNLLHGVQAAASSPNTAGGTYGFRVHRNEFINCVGSGLTILENCSEVSVQHNTFHLCQSIFPRFVSGSFSNNTITNDDAVTLDLLRAAPNVEDREWGVFVQNNTFLCSVFIASSYTALDNAGGEVSALVISGNRGDIGLDIFVFWAGEGDIGAKTMRVEGNRGTSGSYTLILSGSSVTVDRLFVQDNQVGNIDISDGGTGTLNDVRVDTNTLDSDRAATLLSIVTGGSVRAHNNTLYGDSSNTTVGLYVSANGDLCRITDNDIQNVAGHHIHVAGGSSLDSLTVVGNDLRGLPGSEAHLLYVTGKAAQGTISNNTMIRADASDSVIHLNAAAAGDITNISISGNTLRNGTYGIEFTNGDGSCWASGNVFSGQLLEECLGAVGRRFLKSLIVTDTANPSGSTPVQAPATVVTIPANLLKVGDVIKVTASGTSEDGDGITLTTVYCRFAGDLLIKGTVGESSFWFLDASFTVRSVGETGFVQGSGWSVENLYNTPHVSRSDISSVDTTDAITLDIAVADDTGSAPLYVTTYFVELLRPGT